MIPPLRYEIHAELLKASRMDPQVGMSTRMLDQVTQQRRDHLAESVLADPVTSYYPRVVAELLILLEWSLARGGLLVPEPTEEPPIKFLICSKLTHCPWCNEPLTARIGAYKRSRTRNECKSCLVVWSKHIDRRLGGVTQWKWRVLGFIYEGIFSQRPEPWMLDKAREYITSKQAWWDARQAAEAAPATIPINES